MRGVRHATITRVLDKDTRLSLISRVRTVHRLPSVRLSFMETFAATPALGTVLRSAFLACRPHQWVKNLLVFMPLLAAHRVGDPAAWESAVWLFGALCFAASAVYLVNDALDAEHDRQDPVRAARPIAARLLPVRAAFVLSGVLMLLALAGAMWRGAGQVSIVAGYLVLALAYCLFLKRMLWLDIAALAGLYVVRLLGGAYVTNIAPSAWLIAFSGFIFFSLAVLKRYAELRSRAGDRMPGRAYTVEDMNVLLVFGIGTSIAAVIVLALYVDGEIGRMRYQHPYWLWPVCPILLVWFARLWTLANRATMRLDPLMFALRDGPSWAMAAGVFALALIAV